MPHDLVDQLGGRIEDMLAVVHHQQQFACPQVLDHGGFDIEALLLLQPQCRRDCVADRRSVVERRELAEPRAVAEALLFAAGGLEGEPGLADAADTGQRHKRTFSQRGADPHDVVLATDETGCAPRHSGVGPGRDGRPGGRFRNAVCPGSPSRIC